MDVEIVIELHLSVRKRRQTVLEIKVNEQEYKFKLMQERAVPPHVSLTELINAELYPARLTGIDDIRWHYEEGASRKERLLQSIEKVTIKSEAGDLQASARLVALTEELERRGDHWPLLFTFIIFPSGLGGDEARIKYFEEL